MKTIVSILILASSLMSQELKIKANKFNADEKAGISVFEGKVNMIKSNDEINASKVTVHTDTNNKPTKFIALGKVSFKIKTEDGSMYKGKAEKLIYKPVEKEYYFYNNVHLVQIDNKKIIIGEEVILKTTEGKAYAKGAKDEPVIMIFDMPEEKTKKPKTIKKKEDNITKSIEKEDDNATQAKKEE